MINEELNNKFLEIEKVLNKELIGQDDFIYKLCNYFEDKIVKSEKGILLIIEESDIFKNSGISLFFNELKKHNLTASDELDEIDLSSYNFNLGYNSFLSDLYEKLNNSSEAILFKNTEKVSKEILDILSKIHPNSCVNLNDNYVIKNKFLVEADKEEKDTINTFICNNKFFIFLYNNKDFEKEDFLAKNFLPNKDFMLSANSINGDEKNKVIRNELLKKIEEVEDEFKIKIIIGLEDEKEIEDNLGLCSYINEHFIDEGRLSLKEYVFYSIYKPLSNLIRKEGITEKSKLLIFVKENYLYCRSNDNIYKLQDYSSSTLEEIKYKLESTIGMGELKDFIDKVENNYKVQKIREKLGLKTPNISMNMIFTGNAGTGKTNAARITFEYLNALGMLEKAVFLEVSKSDFVGEAINDTAKRTNDIINSAIGGVLFIDEAYSLCTGEDDKIGKEIVDALLKGIEDNRDNLIVILAGYEIDMDRFLSINQGLKSRFSNTINFEDYNPVEMYEIAVSMAKSKGYVIEKNAKSGLIDLFTRNILLGKNDLGNARFVRNIVENAIMDASKKYLANNKRDIDLLDRDNFNFRVSSKFDLEENLESIIGLEKVKDFLRNQYKLIIAQEKRKSAGVNTKIDQNLNMIFAGNPGSGKTSIARLVAKMLNSMGLLKVGQLVETDRSSFISEVPGETPKKTEQKFKEAIGGVLFIDEAYTLANDSLGKEAIETLLKLIEDYSKEVIVILAGYEKEMDSFFDVNAGLRSRFPLWTKFEDYNPNELFEMSLKLIEAKGFRLSKNANLELKNSLVEVYENSDAQSGNGRMVRNYVERLIRNQSIRISESDISVYEMNLINVKDIEKMNSIKHDEDFNLEEKLNNLVGNDNLKDFLRNQYKIMRIKGKRKKLGMEVEIIQYMNMIFTGDSGTGKKTALKILSEMFYNMGITKSKNIVELDRFEFMAMINEKMKVEDILNKYVGKILFIDKWNEFESDIRYNEIVTDIIKFIDKNNNRTIIVLGGNKGKMRETILNNEGLNYRFPTWIDFGSYNEKELYNIAITTLLNKGFYLENNVEQSLETAIGDIQKSNNELTLKNGLMIKKFLDNLIRVQSIRAFDEELNSIDMNNIIAEDIIIAKDEFLKKNLVNSI